MLDKIDGYKTYIFGFMMLALAAAKYFTDIPEIESITMLGADSVSDLASAGFLIITGRSALGK